MVEASPYKRKREKKRAMTEENTRGDKADGVQYETQYARIF